MGWKSYAKRLHIPDPLQEESYSSHTYTNFMVLRHLRTHDQSISASARHRPLRRTILNVVGWCAVILPTYHFAQMSVTITHLHVVWLRISVECNPKEPGFGPISAYGLANLLKVLHKAAVSADEL